MTHIYGFEYMGHIAYIASMKTTIEISDNILVQAKQLAREQNVTLRSLAEEGLRKVIEERSDRGPCRVSPVTFRGKGLSPEFQGATWERIRDAALRGARCMIAVDTNLLIYAHREISRSRRAAPAH